MQGAEEIDTSTGKPKVAKVSTSMCTQASICWAMLVSLHYVSDPACIKHASYRNVGADCNSGSIGRHADVSVASQGLARPPVLLCLQAAEDEDTGEYYEGQPEPIAALATRTADLKGKAKGNKKVQKPSFIMPKAAVDSADMSGPTQEAEEEDSEAARIAQLKGMSKLIHKMSNSISARRPQCFGGQPGGMPGPTDGKQVCWIFLQRIKDHRHLLANAEQGDCRTIDLFRDVAHIDATSQKGQCCYNCLALHLIFAML